MSPPCSNKSTSERVVATYKIVPTDVKVTMGTEEHKDLTDCKLFRARVPFDDGLLLWTSPLGIAACSGKKCLTSSS